MKNRKQPKANSDILVPGASRILVACMPKSGSTFLTTTLGSLPGFRRERLVPGYERREQEIEEARLRRAERVTARQRARSADAGRGYAAQHHVRNSEHTSKLIRLFELRPIVLTRNLFDITVSLRDHFERESPNMAMGYVSEEMRSWPAERMHQFIADMMIPWYFSFYVSWLTHPNCLMMSFDEVTGEPEASVSRIAAFAGFDLKPGDAEAAVVAALGGKSRMNKGLAGRGEALAEPVKRTIRSYARYYPNVDFSQIGIG